MKDVKGKAIRGGFIKVCTQLMNFVLRSVSLMVLARILEPADFGLVGMVTAVTGILSLLKDFGLSTATVQRAKITHEQVSTLFWINILVGVGLACISVAISPFLASFYGDRRLITITALIASGFVFNAAGVQHAALLQRKMRFIALSVIDAISVVAGIVVGVGMALAGFGYWALVAMNVILPVVWTACLWFDNQWFPGKPHKDCEIRSLLQFGGIYSIVAVINYVTCNFDKVLLGRYYGAAALGVYGRAYQLVVIPTDNIMSAGAGGVVFAGLSHARANPIQLNSFFLRAYSLILALTLPMSAFCFVFSTEIIHVALGAKWLDAAVLFRLLAPGVMGLAMISPTAWYLFTIGKLRRSVLLSTCMGVVVITAYLIGLPYGPQGIAIAFSAAIISWTIPHLLWVAHDVTISFRQIMYTLHKPLLSAIIAALVVAPLQLWEFPYLFDIIGGSVLFIVAYMAMLLFVMGEKAFYLDILRELLSQSPDQYETVTADL